MPTLTQDVALCTGALSLVGGVLWYASAWPQSQLFGKVLVAGKDPNEVAITFDDGPNDVATPQILEILARNNVRATFFCVGSFVRQQPGIARDIVEGGHILANHTMTHPKLSLLAADKVRQELSNCNAALEDITGAPIRFFRPPFGAKRPVVLRAAAELGLTPVFWNVTGYDWNPIGVDGILDNLDFGIRNNRRTGRSASNILLHDGGHLAMSTPRPDTVRAVEQLIAAHRGTDTRFVTVDAWMPPSRTPTAAPAGT